MGTFLLPPLKSSEKFEHFVCDLFNCIEETDSYTEFQLFGVSGQNQKGIDIFSQKKRTVIQCKVRNSRGNNESIRRKLLSEIEDDLIKVQGLRFPFDRLIFASTFRDDAQIQEHLNFLHADRRHHFSLHYLGWDSLTHYAEDHEALLTKYFAQFRQKASKPQLPDGALGNDLLKKNYVHYLIKRYAEWKQFELNKKGEKFNYASFNKHVMNRYKAVGINHIPIVRFDEVVAYLQERINKTAFGKNQIAKSIKNYSAFDEYLNDIMGNSENEKGI